MSRVVGRGDWSRHVVAERTNDGGEDSNGGVRGGEREGDGGQMTLSKV